MSIDAEGENPGASSLDDASPKASAHRAGAGAGDIKSRALITIEHESAKPRGFALRPTIRPIIWVRPNDTRVAALFWGRLLEAGLYVNLALPPATPERQSLLRTSVSAAHTAAQIDQAIAAMTSIGLELGVLPGLGERYVSAAQ